MIRDQNEMERTMFARNLWILLGCTLAIGCGSPPPVAPDGGRDDAGSLDAGPPSCPTGTMLCGSECVNTDESRIHCGDCDSACGAGEACVDGACDIVCPSGQTECAGICADTATNRLHCGGCGISCTDGEICAGSSCVVSCPGGQTACDGSCVDTQSSAAHCGACGDACEPGQVCSAGECTTTCAPGVMQCGADCVDAAHDPDHCGDCDTSCPTDTGAAPLCMSGTCRLACDALWGDCNGDLGRSGGDGCESTLATDAANCGACGRTCSFPAAVTGCAAGACTIASCDAGFDDCDGARDNGCEAELADDPMNCGACGTVCGTNEGCFAGVCAPIGGESCDDALAIRSGTNTVYWTATTNDYLTAATSCTATAASGPDAVFAYTATADEQVTFTVVPPASTRWTMVATATCGAISSGMCASASAASMVASQIVAAGETVYLHVVDTTSGSSPLSNPLTIDVTTTPVPCIPGAGGVVGTTVTRIPTGLPSLTEYYFAADEDPAGYVYIGGTGELYRVPKAGGAVEDVEALASLTASHLGYAMVVDGPNIYVVESKTTGINGYLWRISTDGGATWGIRDYAAFPSVPADDFKAATVYGGRIYLLTSEGTAGTATQIWSVDANAPEASLPTVATLELSIDVAEGDCLGIDRDATHYYLTCYDGDRTIRVPAAGGTPELLTNAFTPYLSTYPTFLEGDDLDGDGTYDVLYSQYGYEIVGFACGLDTATPFATTLVDYGGSSSNNGMAFDRTNGVIWAYDDDSREILSIR